MRGGIGLESGARIRKAMARVRLNSALNEVRGDLDGFVFKHYAYGTVVSRRPRMAHLTLTPAQRAQRERFKAAAKFYRTVLADPALKRRYTAQAKKEGVPLSAVTLRVYLRPKG